MSKVSYIAKQFVTYNWVQFDNKYVQAEKNRPFFSYKLVALKSLYGCPQLLVTAKEIT